MKVIVLTIFIIQMLFVGCNSFKQAKLTDISSQKSEIKEISTEKNKVLTTNIGDEIFTYNKYESITSLVFKNEKPLVFPNPEYIAGSGVTFNETKMLLINKDSLVSFKKIYLSDLNKNENWIFYNSVKVDFDKYNFQWDSYFKIQNDTLFSINYHQFDRNYVFNPPIPVQKLELETKGKNLFSFELIYLGIQNNSIVLSYREYTEDMLRSNFSQSVYYNVSEIKDNVIQYKNVKIKIIDYNNQNIKYMVID